MGYVPDWQRQNMKKTGSSGPTTSPSRKDLGSLFHSSPAPQSKSVTKPMRLADGDTEETYKQRGLEASSGDNVGFFERLRMGNIDQPGSEAYNRFGAGRGKEVDAETTRLANRSAAAAEARDRDLESMDTNTGASAPAPRSEYTVKTTAADFQRTDKDTTPVSVSRRSVAPVRKASSSVSGSTFKAADTNESAAETARLSRRPSMPDQTDSETRRLASAPRPVAKYEAPYDRFNRENRERAAARSSSREAERERLRENVRSGSSGEIDPKTLLPKR